MNRFQSLDDEMHILIYVMQVGDIVWRNVKSSMFVTDVQQKSTLMLNQY